MSVLSCVIGAAAGLAFGSAVSTLNVHITEKYILNVDNQELLKTGTSRIMAINAVRLLLDAAALFVVFILRNVLPFSFIPAIIGTAFGLSVVSFFMLYKAAGTKKNDKKEGRG